MKISIKNRAFIIGIFFLTIIILGLTQNTKFSYAQPQYDKENRILIVPSNFLITEFSEDCNSGENLTSIDLSLPSPTWNLTDIEVNFTDIEFKREIKTIEDGIDAANYIDKLTIRGLAVQINISAPTIVYGIQIYGSAIIPQPADIVNIQLQGYDNLNNQPDGIPLRTVNLNMSTDAKWYIQEFSTPIMLNEGNYSLVMIKSNIQNPTTKYQWWYSYSNPTNPDLYNSLDLGSGWTPGYKGTPQVYKLDQKLNFTFKPQDINMEAEISGDHYTVIDGTESVKGNLTISNVNYTSTTSTLSISIKNNESTSLLFNATYTYNLKNILISGGTVSIRETFNNTWTISPIFYRPSNNYSIKFDYPNSWFNLTVFNSSGILYESTDYVNDGNVIFIPNNTLTSEIGWKITANSEKVNFNADPQESQYLPGQLLRIFVDAPVSVGNLSFLLIDRDGNIVYNETLIDHSDSYTFSYTILSSPTGLPWKALIFWNNYTDAGLQTIELQINTPVDGGGDDDSNKTIITGINPQLIYMSILYIIIGSVAGLSSYMIVKRHKRNKAVHRQKIFNKYMDLLNLDYIMIVDKNSGLNVYEQVLAGKDRDISLISGFLEAIRSFGIELSGSEDESQAIRLQYQNMNIIMNDYKNFRILNIMKEPPSQDFLDALRPLSHDIDTYYGKSFKEFDGKVAKFKGIKDLLEIHLHTSLIYPLKVVESKEVKIDSAEKALVSKALNIMKKNNSDHFFVSYLMGAGKEFNVKNAEVILKLIQKKVFQQIE